MEQPKRDSGTKKDLVLYRIQTAKSDLKSARILLAEILYCAAGIFERWFGVIEAATER